MPTKLYDDEDTSIRSGSSLNGSHDDLGVSEDERQKEIDELERLYRGEEDPKEKELSADGISDAEDAEVEPEEDDDYSERTALYQKTEDENFYVDNARTNITSSRKLRRTAIFGAFGSLGLGFSVILMLFLPGLKLTHLVENMSGKFFANSRVASEVWADKITTNYLKKHIFPSLQGTGVCSSTRTSANCIQAIEGNGPLATLYRGWRDRSFEQKIWENHGIAFERSGSSVRMVTRNGDIDLPEAFLTDNRTIGSMTEGKSQIRRAFLDAIDRESNGSGSFRRRLDKYRIGKFIERKYGVRRCIVACQSRDKLSEWGDNKRLAFKAKLVDRVIAPRNESVGLIMQCLLNTSCDTRNLDRSEDGVRRNAVEKQIDAKLRDFSAKYGREAASELLEKVAIIEADLANGKSLTRVAIERFVTGLASETAGDIAGKAVPVIGWVDFAASLITKIKTLDTGLKRMVYTANATAAVATFTMIASQSNEITAGLTDDEITGSFISALGDDTGAPAEAAPIFDYLMGTSSNPRQTSYNESLFFGTALAQSTAENGYICNDGTPVSGYLCPEDKLLTSNIFEGILDALTNNPVFSTLSTVVGWYNSTVGGVLSSFTDLFGSLLSAIPGISQIGEFASKVVEPLLDLIRDYLIVGAFPDDTLETSGAKLITVMGAGANVAGNEFASYGMGAPLISDTDRVAVVNYYKNEQIEQFQTKSFAERMFDTKNPQSLVGSFALSIPFSSSPLRSLAKIVYKSPRITLGAIANGFNKKALAAEIPMPDPYGVPQHGHALNSEIYDIDVNSLTPERCREYQQAWEDSVEFDESTGTDVYKKSNPCKIHEAVIESLAGNATGIQATAPTVQNPTQQTQLVEGDTTNIACQAGTDAGTALGYEDGRPVNIRLCDVSGIKVNSQYSLNTQRLMDAARADGIDLSGGGFRTMESQRSLRVTNGCPNVEVARADSCRVPTARPGFSNHQMGYAIDFRCNGQSISSSSPCFIWLRQNAGVYGYINLPSEPWHWSKDGS